MVEDPIRTRKNRTEQTIRGSEVVGGVKVNATQYVTGRTEVMTQTLVPCNAQQASYTFN